jgi:hypothetical protein
MPGVLASVWSLCAYALGLVAGGTGSTELIAGAAVAAATLLAIAIWVHVATGGLLAAGYRLRRRPAPRERARPARLPLSVRSESFGNAANSSVGSSVAHRRVQ